MRSLAAAACAFAALAAAAEGSVPPPGRRASRPEAPDWEFSATGYWNAVRSGKDYASGIFAADRGALHLEARANYEAIHAQSAFVGWTFTAGERVKVEVTPIVGFVGGSLHGTIAGVEASVAAGRFDYYVEAEYVRDRDDESSSYTYAWSELGFSPTEGFRLGLVAQRTRTHGGDRDVLGGGFAQLVRGPVTFGAYWFNPGSSDQVVIVSVGASF